MKWTLFFSSLLTLSIALTGCAVYHPYGPYGSYGSYGYGHYGQSFVGTYGKHVPETYPANGVANVCAANICEPVCGPCATPVMQPSLNYAYGGNCYDPCDPCAEPVCRPVHTIATPLAWLASVMRGLNYPCHGCGDEVYWGDYGQTPHDVCNPCTYDGHWGGSVDRKMVNPCDPCNPCGSCNVCQQGTSFRYPAIGAYMNRLFAPVFQDKIAPTHGNTPLDYGLRDPGSLCHNPCVDPCYDPCMSGNGMYAGNYIASNQANHTNHVNHANPQNHVAANPPVAPHHSPATIHNSPPNATQTVNPYARNLQAYLPRKMPFSSGSSTGNPTYATMNRSQNHRVYNNAVNNAAYNNAHPAYNNNAVYNHAHYNNNGTTLSSALPVSYETPHAVPQLTPQRMQTATNSYHPPVEQTTYQR